MTEVFGKCLSVDDTKMMILDEDNDEIEMDMTHVMKMKWTTQKYKEFLYNLVGKHVSFYYDRNGIKIKEIKADEPTITTFPSGTRRTLKSFLENKKA